MFMTGVFCTVCLCRQSLLLSPCSLCRHKQTLFGVIRPLAGGKCRMFRRVIERYRFHQYLCFHCMFCVWVFSAPEPKAQVHYCDHTLSVVRRMSVVRRLSVVNFHIFDFSSETTEQNSTKLDRKQDLNVLYQVCVFWADRKNKMAAPSSDWLRHF